MIKLNDYLEEATKELKNNLNELEEQIVMGFVDEGAFERYSYNEAAKEYAQICTSLDEEETLEWLSGCYSKVMKVCTEAIKKGDVNLNRITLDQMICACHMLANEDLLKETKKKEIIHYKKIEFLIKYGYKEIAEEIYERFICRVDGEYLDFWDMEEIIVSVLKELSEEDVVDRDGE